VESLNELLRQGGLLAFPAAFLGGVISSLNPCCVPIYPAAAGCCTALRGDTVGRNLRVATAFVLGGCTTTSFLGIASALAGRVFMALGSWPVYLLSALPIVFGLHLLGVVRLPLPSRTAGPPSMKGTAGAAVAGALLGLAVVPCATPILGGILAYVATQRNPCGVDSCCSPTAWDLASRPYSSGPHRPRLSQDSPVRGSADGPTTSQARLSLVSVST